MWFSSISSASRRPLASLLSPTRRIHPSPAAYKTVTEKVSEVADAINKKVGKGLASAIDKGEEVTESAKQTLSSASQKTEKAAKETSEMVGQKKDQAAEGMRETKDDVAKHMKK